MVTVITQTTSEREEETRNLFNRIKPLLNKGYRYSSATCKVLGLKKVNTRQAWYRELIRYGESQGYDYKEYSGQRKGLR